MPEDVLVNNKAYVEYKGAFTEQFVCQQSLTTIIKENEELKGIKVTMSDYREQDKITNVPLYAIEEWFRKREEAMF